ncbi:Uncharacterised protein [Legionella cherrii]|uniref:Uncharacterized protein n=1 Tax=Legionella cherrii TaxID=28084 RepID=A0A0W0SCY2_9GAMM|nr:hypothetical protein Lche_3005 [Legionella cherrii]VEB33906.1 Uncharacterised protein [Legionella cherrii]
MVVNSSEFDALLRYFFERPHTQGSEGTHTVASCSSMGDTLIIAREAEHMTNRRYYFKRAKCSRLKATFSATDSLGCS